MSHPVDEASRSRPRRRLPCFTITNLAAAATLGFLLGVALASTVFAQHIRDHDQTSSDIQPESQHAGTWQFSNRTTERP